MKALSLFNAGNAQITEIAEPKANSGDLLLRIAMVGLCGTDLNSFRGRNPLISYPRVLGHEIAATVLEGNGSIVSGTRVTVSPYTNCGI
ncbi:MAG: alcohol dehydrogenase catalytic domain-containing protein, partial [Edaphobacter sp.]